jgi:hypothetical protein
MVRQLGRRTRGRDIRGTVEHTSIRSRGCITTAAPCTPCRFGEIQHLTNDSRDRVIIFQ